MTKKIWELPELASISDDDIFLVANDPAGTPTTRYITAANLNYASKSAANVFTAGPQQITIDAAGNKGFIIKGANSQSANPFEVQNSSGSAIAYITAAGVFTGNGSGLTNISHLALSALDYASSGHTGFAGTGVSNVFSATRSTSGTNYGQQLQYTTNWAGAASSTYGLSSELTYSHSVTSGGSDTIRGVFSRLNAVAATSSGAAGTHFLYAFAGEVLDYRTYQNTAAATSVSRFGISVSTGGAPPTIDTGGQTCTYTTTGVNVVNTPSYTVSSGTLNATTYGVRISGEASSAGAAACVGYGVHVANTGSYWTDYTGVYVAVPTAASKGIVVRGAASQTGNLTEWRDSNNNLLASINASGVFSGVAGGSVLRTTFATQPAAGTAGRLWVQSDGPYTAYDDGSIWNYRYNNHEVKPPTWLNSVTWLNQLDRTLTSTSGYGSFITPPGAGYNQVGGFVKSIAVPYDVRLVFTRDCDASTNVQVGFVIKKSTGDRFLTFSYTGANSVLRGDWNAYDNLNGNYLNRNHVVSPPGALLFMRAVNPGSGSRTFYVSSDNTNWAALNTTGWNEWISDEDQIGVYCYNNSSVRVCTHLIHWEEV